MREHGGTIEGARKALSPRTYQILVSTVRNDGRPIRTRFHGVWDAKVREITGGLTISSPVKGQWINGDGRLYAERMIPVLVVCTRAQIDRIVAMTADYYEQEAVLAMKISDEIVYYVREDDRVYHGR